MWVNNIPQGKGVYLDSLNRERHVGTWLNGEFHGQGVHTYADSDRMILGTTAPKWLLGLNNSFNYKGFDLGTFVMVRWGQTIQSKLWLIQIFIC